MTKTRLWLKQYYDWNNNINETKLWQYQDNVIVSIMVMIDFVIMSETKTKLIQDYNYNKTNIIRFIKS